MGYLWQGSALVERLDQNSSKTKVWSLVATSYGIGFYNGFYRVMHASYYYGLRAVSNNLCDIMWQLITLKIVWQLISLKIMWQLIFLKIMWQILPLSGIHRPSSIYFARDCVTNLNFVFMPRFATKSTLAYRPSSIVHRLSSIVHRPSSFVQNPSSGF